MERRAGRAHVVLRHEGHRAALLPGDLLHPVLVEHVAVGHLERVGVAQVDLLLPPPPLALGELDRHPRRLHPVADGAHQRLLLRGLEDVVVLQVVRHRGEAVVTLGPRLVEGLAEEVELELGGGLHPVADPGGALELAPEHPARRLLDGLALLGVDVAEHERGLGQPRQQAPGGEVGHQLHVAVAPLPRGELEARQRLHLHVHREEVDAGVDAVVQHVVEEVAADDALAHQPAEPVREDGEHGVDVALLDQRLEGLAVCPILRHGKTSRPTRTAQGREGSAKRRNLTRPGSRLAIRHDDETPRSFGVRSYIPTFHVRETTRYTRRKCRNVRPDPQPS